MMKYNYLTEVPVNSNASSTVRSLSVDHPDNLFLEGFRLEVGLHELEDLMNEVIIRFDTNPSNYLKDDYLHLIALIIKEFDRLSSLHEKVSILESINIDIKGGIESNLDRIEEVRGLVINLNTDLRNINNTIQTINNNIDALQARDSIFTKSIEDINTSILKHIEDYSKDVASINTTIELLNINIDTIDSNIEKLFNRKILEGDSVENYVSLSVESDADDNTIITLDDTLLKLELYTVDNNISNINTKITEISNVLGKVYKVKGSTTVDNINSMTVDTAMIGHVYNLLDSGVITNGIEGELEVVKGNNIVYTEDGWDEFAVSLDLDQCAGNNISIENNIISALGYKYNPSYKSITIGSDYNNAIGYLAFALGDGTRAPGEKAHAEGGQTTASGRLAHAEGSNTVAKGDFSHTEGKGTLTNNESEHALGMYNISNIGLDIDMRTTLYSIGVGDSIERRNAHEVMNNGDTFIIGIGEYDGTNPYEAQTLQKVINSKVEKEEGKYLSSNDYTNSDKEKVSLIESLQTTILKLQEKVNSKEYSIDFESDSTTAQEINLMDSMSLKKLVGYNITSVNLQIGTGSAVNLVLTDNVWEGDPIVINQSERVYWDIVKYDESAPAVLGIYETKIL